MDARRRERARTRVRSAGTPCPGADHERDEVVPNAPVVIEMMKKIIVTPCIVKSSSYVSGATTCSSACASWERISSASTPPGRRRRRAWSRIEKPDPLVVGGGQPAEEARAALPDPLEALDRRDGLARRGSDRHQWSALQIPDEVAQLGLRAAFEVGRLVAGLEILRASDPALHVGGRVGDGERRRASSARPDASGPGR